MNGSTLMGTALEYNFIVESNRRRRFIELNNNSLRERVYFIKPIIFIQTNITFGYPFSVCFIIRKGNFQLHSQIIFSLQTR